MKMQCQMLKGSGKRDHIILKTRSNGHYFSIFRSKSKKKLVQENWMTTPRSIDCAPACDESLIFGEFIADLEKWIIIANSTQWKILKMPYSSTLFKHS